jgi:hypothetical protein
MTQRVQTVHRHSKVAVIAWRAPLAYGATGLKEAEGQIPFYGPPLLRAGYTLFAIIRRVALGSSILRQVSHANAF